MEQRAHIPGYGKEEALQHDLEREMTMEELDAMEAPEVTVVRTQKEVRGGTRVHELGFKIKSTQEKIEALSRRMHAISEQAEGPDAMIRATLKTNIKEAEHELKELQDKLMESREGGNA